MKRVLGLWCTSVAILCGLLAYTTLAQGPDDTRWTTFTTQDGLISNSVETLFYDASGNLWVGTDKGVSRYNGRSGWQSFTPTDFVTTDDGAQNSSALINHFQDIWQDREGNFWFATLGGLSRYDGQEWQFLSFELEGSPTADRFHSVFQDSEGYLWFGACFRQEAEGMAIRYNPTDDTSEMFIAEENTAVPSSENNTILRGDILSMAQTDDGTLWFGDMGSVTRLAPNGTWLEAWTQLGDLDLQVGEWLPDVNAIVVDDENKIWFGTTAGVALYDAQRSWRTFTRANSDLPSNYVRDLWIDRTGDLWIATSEGASHYDGNQWETFTTENSGIAGDSVRSVWGDGAGRVWLGTDAGLSCYRSRSWEANGGLNGPADNLIHDIWGDASGKVWFNAPIDLPPLDRMLSAMWMLTSTSHFFSSAQLHVCAVGQPGVDHCG
jgi:ligand-binding sensor domain-containing protein